MKNKLCAEIHSYIYDLSLTDKTSNEKQHWCRNSFLYFISTPYNHLLPRFWFYLRYTNKSMFGLHMLSFNLFYVLYLLLITVRRPALGLTLDINK